MDMVYRLGEGILSDPMPGQVKVFIGCSGWLPTETYGTSPGKDTPEHVSIALFIPLFVRSFNKYSASTYGALILEQGGCGLCPWD